MAAMFFEHASKEKVRDVKKLAVNNEKIFKDGNMAGHVTLMFIINSNVFICNRFGRPRGTTK